MNNDINLTKKQIKGNIQQLIDKGKIAEAKELINEYKVIVNDDVEAYSIEAVIAIIENKLNDAENILIEGLEIDNKNYDLLYNLAYIFETKQDYIKSLAFYRKALRFNYYNIDRKEIENIIEQLKLTIINNVNDKLCLGTAKITNILFIDFDNNEKVNNLAQRLESYGINVDIAYRGTNPLYKLANKNNPYRKVLGITNIDDLIEYAEFYNYDDIHLFNASSKIKKYFIAKSLKFTTENLFCKTDDEIMDYYANNKSESFINNQYIETNNITIIVPTFNRPYYLNRTLTYINSYKYLKPKVMVLDSSEESSKIINENNVKRFNNVNILYKQYPSSIRVDKKISSALLKEKIGTEYVAICFDDDFLTEEGIIKSINELDKDKELFAAKGKNLFYGNSMGNLVEYDWFEGLKQSNAIDRLKKITQGFFPNFAFIVFRTEKYIKLQQFSDENMELFPQNSTFIEYLYHFLIIATSKITKINVDLNVRDQSIQRAQQVENFPHAVMNASFNDNYHAFCNILKRYFIYLGIDVQNFDDEIEFIFSDFLVNFLAVPRKYVEIKDNEFNLKKLETGMRKSWVWPSSL